MGPAADLTLGSACSAGSIGCLPNAFADIDLNGLGEGEHSLTFSVYQLGGGPFGLLYSGSVDSVNASLEVPSPTPEPGTFLLLGGGMLGLAVVLRRMKR